MWATPKKSLTNFANLAALHPERVIETDWGVQTTGVFACDIIVDAHDRQGLLRDISEIFTRERLNVVGVNTRESGQITAARLTLEVRHLTELQQAIANVRSVPGVLAVVRG